MVETGLVRFKLSAGSRPDEWNGELIADAVGGPDLILVAARGLPGHLVSARRLRRGDRGIIAILGEFAGKDRRPGIAQLDRRAAIRLKKIVGPVRQQAHRAGGL